MSILQLNYTPSSLRIQQKIGVLICRNNENSPEISNRKVHLILNLFSKDVVGEYQVRKDVLIKLL